MGELERVRRATPRRPYADRLGEQAIEERDTEMSDSQIRELFDVLEAEGEKGGGRR